MLPEFDKKLANVFNKVFNMADNSNRNVTELKKHNFLNFN